MPDFSLESEIDGKTCGLDEVGRGPLAGPVVAACVYIPPEHRTLPFIPDIRDSKTLSHAKLETLYALIDQHFVWGVAELGPDIIDEINILQASLRAMRMAMENTGGVYAHALVDGSRMPDLPCPARTVVKGDGKSVSIAAASIMAKVTRDRIMRKLHEEHPHYGWNTNVGYPSQQHRDAILTHGITPHHRKSFGPVKKFIEENSQDSATSKAAVSAG